MGGFVVGLPLNLDGSRARAPRPRAHSPATLRRSTALPILLWDERLSTAAAERSLLEADASRRRSAEVIDKVCRHVDPAGRARSHEPLRQQMTP